MKVTSIKPLAAKPGDVVTVTGVNLTPQAVLMIGDQQITWSSSDGTTAKFVMPALSRAGAFEVRVGRYKDPTGLVDDAAKYILSDSAGDGHPILMATPADVCKSVVFRDAEGIPQVGTKDCDGGTLSDCASDGETGCLATATFKAARLANFAAGDVEIGTTIAGVAGTANFNPSNCASDGASNCLVNGSTYKAAAVSNLTAGNIKNGVTIGGVAGLYPSATYPLAGSTATADLSATDFTTHVKSATAFEYWDSAGVRQTGNGDANIVASNIASGVSILGTAGTLTSPDPWDLRIGKTVVTPTGTVTGKLPVNCRNTANLTVSDISLPAVGVSGPAVSSGTWTITYGVSTVAVGDKLQLIAGTPPGGFTNGSYYYVVGVSLPTFALSTTAVGSAITATSAGDASMQLIKVDDGTAHLWDTIDDYNNNITGLPPLLVSGSSAATRCDGIEITAGDAHVWRDVTTTGNGVTSSNCSTSETHCSYLDKISGLEWSKASGTTLTWPAAVAYCDGLTHNGKFDWRIPTQKELMNAYQHGIRSTQSSSFVNSFGNFWSGSTVSFHTDSAWDVNLAYGNTDNYLKTNTTSVICVRP
jgi:hypothetical protein